MNQGNNGGLQQVEDILMLSPMQEGLLYHYIQDPTSELYFEQICLWIASPIQLVFFEQAWNWVIQTNELLRSVFRWKKVERPVQIVWKERPFAIHREDWSHWSAEEQELQWAAWQQRDRQAGFDLEQGPLIRVTVCKMGAERYAVLISFHHIILDGWSTGLMVKEVWQAYADLVAGRGLERRKKPRVKEYLRWLKSQDTSAGEAYWRTYLTGFETKSRLPLARENTVRGSETPAGYVDDETKSGETLAKGRSSSENSRINEGTGTFLVHLPTALVTSVESVVRRVGITLSSFLNVAWGILLQRYNNCDDVLFGMTVSGRPTSVLGIEEMLGLFINTIPVRVRKEKGHRVSDLLQVVHQEGMARSGAEYLPLVQIKAQSEVDPQSTLFDSIVVVENYPLDQRVQELGVQIVGLEAFETTNFDLTLVVSVRTGIELKWIYNTQAYTPVTIQELSKLYCQVLDVMVQNPEQEVGQLSFVSNLEREQLLYEFNDSHLDISQEQTILHLWAERVQECPDTTALLFGQTSLTYRELEHQAKEVAGRLRRLGVQPETIVGIMMEPSIDMVVGILGILQAGGAYLPIDPKHPEDRIQYMLTDCRVPVLLTQTKWEKRCKEYEDVNVIILDDPTMLHESEPSLEMGIRVQGNNLAYVIYTSGSTGKPKGVLIEHHSLMNLLIGMQFFYPTSAGDTWLLKTPYTFDVSLTELFGWMIGGGRLAILEPGGEKEPQAIYRALQMYEVSHVNFVPSMYNAFIDYMEMSEAEVPASLQYLMVAGEAITKEQVKQFYRWIDRSSESRDPGQCQLINLYGPTEATIYATHFPLQNVERYPGVPIGHGMPNTDLYILDGEMNLQPIGFPGELCIAGRGVARGYLNRPELTAERFVANPYRPGSRLYRTGDLTRWLPDGNVEFIGRLDQQVKIRGYRIEIGEVENRLLSHPTVKAAAVLAREDRRGGKYLCAYVILGAPRGERWLDELRSYLAAELPEYMIPTHFIQLDTMPLTASGKLNRNALPEPDSVAKGNDYVAPRTEWEERLQRIWQDLLEVEPIGVHDHFFQRGGHSLKAVQVVARLYKEWGLEVTVRDLFAAPTVAELAAKLETMEYDAVAPIPTQPEGEWYPLTSAQRRLYLLQQLDGDSTVYNMPITLEVIGPVHLQRWEEALRQLVQRHAALRTQFALIEGEPRQRVVRELDFQMGYRDQETGDRLDGFVRPFDWCEPPLMRAEMVRRGEDRHIFQLDLHHIIADGISLDIFIDEFVKLYQGEELAQLRLQYPDFAVWQDRKFAAAEQPDAAYWHQELGGELPMLNLPTDYPRPMVQSFLGDVLTFHIGADCLKQLQTVALANGATLFMALLACYNLLLGRYCGVEDVIVGTPVEGRTHPDLQGVMGMFVNTLPIRTQWGGGLTFREYLQRVQETVLHAMEHQEYPFERLLDDLELARDLSKNPLFDTVFVMETMQGREKRAQIPGLELRYQDTGNPVAKFDLTLYAEERVDGLALRWEYCTKLFTVERMERMAGHLTRIITHVATDPEVHIQDIQMLSSEEKDRLLFLFNDTESAYPREATIGDLFHAQAQRMPDKVAVRMCGGEGSRRVGGRGPQPEGIANEYVEVQMDDTALTYGELDALSDQLAIALVHKGVEPDQLVGLHYGRSMEMIVGILGILKAGGAYLPIDPDWPQERKEWLLKDADVAILLGQDLRFTEVGGCMLECAEMAVTWDGCYPMLSMEWSGYGAGCRTAMREGAEILTYDQKKQSVVECEGDLTSRQPINGVGKVTSDHLAYVMYTSGSTGQPKGVMVPHRGVIRLLYNTNYIYLDETERILQMAPYSFDASTFEIWASLLFGGELILLPKEDVLSISRLSEALHRERITTCWLTASLLNRVVDEAPAGLSGLKNLLVGGEALSVPHIRKVLPYLPNTRLINGYGPTENTTFTCCYTIYEPCTQEEGITKDVTDDALSSIPIGKPIRNTRVYILDRYMRLVPQGVVGELYIAGDGLARGYLKHDDWTAERFVEHPLLPGERLYRSGDLGWYLPDGNIAFLGRVDHQVKVRGYRIELGEIEANLLRHPQIHNAVVLVREGAAGKELIAYIASDNSLTIPELRDHLTQTLPEYMLPNYFVLLPSLPLLANGKVDRRSLPEPEGFAPTGIEYVAPTNEIEERLALLYREILQVDRVSIYDNFFHLGGHSLKAARLAARIVETMQMDVPLREIFLHPVLKDLAAVMTDSLRSDLSPIPKQAEQEYYPLSSAQKRVYIMHQFNDASTAYNIPSAYWLEGELDESRLENALQLLIRRHESLRTSFHLVDGEPMQKIHRDIAFRITRHTLQENELYPYLRSLTQPFDLAQAPLLRIHLIRVESPACEQSSRRLVLYMDIHHIIADGRSMEILMEEFVQVYIGAELSKIELQYRDFAVWQHERLHTAEMGHNNDLMVQKMYWFEQFQEEIPALQLPLDHPRPPVQTYRGDCMALNLDPELTRKLEVLAERQGVTLYMLLLAVYSVFLSRYSGQNDLVIGTPIAGRKHPATQNIFGMFVNTLAIRMQPQWQQSFVEYLQNVKGQMLHAYEHQEYPFEWLVDQLNLPRDLSRNPVFDTMFDLQNWEGVHGQEIRLPAGQYVQIRPCTMEPQIAKFDLNLTVVQVENRLQLQLTYATDLFLRRTVEQMGEHCIQLFQAVATNPSETLGRLPMLTTAEREEILYRWNDHHQNLPQDRTVYQLFEEIAEQSPHATALILGDETLSYGELNRQANQWAWVLRKKGVRQETLVALMVERSFAMLIGLFGVWKAGGAFVPIDPAYPEDRIQYMLDEAGVAILLTQRHLEGQIPAGYTGEVMFVDSTLDLTAAESLGNPPHTAETDHLAYMIYTSGSTGRPKGVLEEHRSLLNTLQWRKNEYQFTCADRVLQLFSFSFDGFLISCITPLIAGSTVVLLCEAEAKNPLAIRRVIRMHQVTHCIIVPSLFSSLLDCLTSEDLTSLRGVALGGEAVSAKLIQRSKALCSTMEISNEYGPTENGVVSTIQRDLQSDGRITIGRAIANTQLYILDRNLEPVPVGVIGEIYVAGAGLARGYQNRPELTAERFVANPFASGERMYRTGDLGRYWPDGSVEYVGRMDHQVKVRGYRMELGEIESVFLTHPAVKDVVVTARTDAEGNAYLVGYFTGIQGIPKEEIQRYLANKLPDYMVPAYYCQLEQFPVTPNGKIDLRALPEVAVGVEYTAPITVVEKQLAVIWEEVLDVPRIGRDDHFFELGGHSLKAMQVLTRVYKECQVELPMHQLFQYPVLKDLAAWIEGAHRGIYRPIPKLAEQEYYPVSSAQKRMFVLNQLEGESISYNMPMVVEIEGVLEMARLEAAIRTLIRRHESLHTRFQLVDGVPMQQVLPEVAFELSVSQADFLDPHGDLEKAAANVPYDKMAIDEYIRNLVRPFDIGAAPLFRVELIQMTEDRSLLFLDMHHIISDGVSMNIWVREVVAAYNGEGLPAGSAQYRDFALWQNEQFASGSLQRHEEYWLKELAGDLPVLHLPTDFPRPALQNTDGSTVYVAVEPKLWQKVNRVTEQTGTTQFMLLLSAFTLLLSKYSGQEELMIGTPVAGRQHPDLESTIGMFVNMLAIRLQATGSKRFEEFVNIVKDKSIEALAHQDYPFEMLVEELHLERDLARHPLFDVVFVLQNVMDQRREWALNGVTFREYQWDYSVAKFDLTLTVSEVDGGAQCMLNYATHLFERETIERMGRYYCTILQAIVDDPTVQLQNVNLLSEEERDLLLYAFNATEAKYPADRTIHQLFEEQAAADPARVAVVLGNERMTYGELNARANQVAHALRERGVGPDCLVGIFVERSLEMIVGIFGILKAGGAYVPLDPEYPVERIAYMLDDAGITVLLTQMRLLKYIPPMEQQGCLLLDELSWCEAYPKANPVNYTMGDHLAYIIYTSGSTGRPKGVMIEHRNVVRLLKVEPSNYDFTEADVWTLFHSYCFDFSVWEIFGPLLFGGRLVIVEAEVRIDPERFLALCRRERVTVLNQTPAAFYQLIQAEQWASEHTLHEHLRYVIFGGEALNFTKLIPWVQMYPLETIALVNMYGITETTVHVTFERIRQSDLHTGHRSLVGRPIYTNTLYLLDGQQHLVPVGVAGEICVGGLGLARGYLNRPELTAEKFIPHPFIPGERLYRSGDLGKFRPDGNLEYLGRIDQQVKIRGFRIEIGEIEETLLQYPGVQDAVVIQRTDSQGGKYLAGYVVLQKAVDMAEGNGQHDTLPQKLKVHLAKTLPDYMVPAAIVVLDAMPLTSNGKVNRKALPEPILGSGQGSDYVAPRNPLEEELAAMWGRVLGLEQVSVEESFFDLGGNSLRLITVFNELKQAYPDNHFNITDLFKYNSIAALAEYLQTILSQGSRPLDDEMRGEDDDEIEEFIM